MKSILWFLVSGLMFILGFTLIAWRWKGNANVSLGIPISGASVQFCGSATGGLAVCGLLALLLAIVCFIVAVLRWIFPSSDKPDAPLPGKTLSQEP